MIFSRLDFKDNWQEKRIRGLFTYLNKFHTPIHTGTTSIKKMCRYETIDVSVAVKYYDKEYVLQRLIERVDSEDRYVKQYADIWQSYIKILSDLVPIGIQENNSQVKKKIYPSNEKRKARNNANTKKIVARENVRRYFEDKRD